MTGRSEVRVNGPRRHHYRLFYRLDYDAKDRPKPLLVVVNLGRQARQPATVMSPR